MKGFVLGVALVALSGCAVFPLDCSERGGVFFCGELKFHSVEVTNEQA